MRRIFFFFSSSSSFYFALGTANSSAGTGQVVSSCGALLSFPNERPLRISAETLVVSTGAPLRPPQVPPAQSIYIYIYFFFLTFV